MCSVSLQFSIICDLFDLKITWRGHGCRGVRKNMEKMIYSENLFFTTNIVVLFRTLSLACDIHQITPWPWVNAGWMPDGFDAHVPYVDAAADRRLNLFLFIFPRVHCSHQMRHNADIIYELHKRKPFDVRSETFILSSISCQAIIHILLTHKRECVQRSDINSLFFARVRCTMYVNGIVCSK